MDTIGNQWKFAESMVGESIYDMEKGLMYRVGVVSDICYHYGPAVIIRWPDGYKEPVGVGRLKLFTSRSRSGYFYKRTQEEPQAR